MHQVPCHCPTGQTIAADHSIRPGLLWRCMGPMPAPRRNPDCKSCRDTGARPAGGVPYPVERPTHRVICTCRTGRLLADWPSRHGGRDHPEIPPAGNPECEDCRDTGRHGTNDPFAVRVAALALLGRRVT